MATEAQINANRQNAEKSTGPRTAEGKAAVSQNAVKHGLFADETVVKGENQADFDLHRDTFLAEMAPVGAIESMLAERIVGLSWRLRRAERMQNQAIDEMIEGLKPSRLQVFARQSVPRFLREPEKPVPEPRLALGRVAKKDWANNRVLDRMMMYERRIENSMLKTMRELERLQLLRQLDEAESGHSESPAETCLAQNHRGDLKKQSQFAQAENNVNSFAKEDYENKSRRRRVENKANQCQSPAFGRKSETTRMPVQ